MITKAPDTPLSSRDLPPSSEPDIVALVGDNLRRVRIRNGCHRLETGDAISFRGDQPHCYRNAGVNEAHFYVVMIYAERYQSTALFDGLQ